MKNTLIILSIALLIAINVGCEKDAQTPDCVSGTVLGTTCEGAYLLQLDTDFPFGASLYFSGDMGRALPGPAAVPNTYANVVETFTLSPSLSRGQQVFLRLRPATSEETIERFCTANKVWYDAPQVIVTDSSYTSCKSFSVK